MNTKHYKMYKSGKKWVIGVIITAAATIGLAENNVSANISTPQEINNSVVKDQSTGLSHTSNENDTYKANIFIYDEQTGKTVNENSLTYNSKDNNIEIVNPNNIKETRKILGNNYEISAPTNYKFDNEYNQIYDSQRWPSYENVSDSKVTLNFKKELGRKTANGGESILSSRHNDVYQLWVQKNGTNKNSITGVPDDDYRTVLNYYVYDGKNAGEFVGNSILNDYSQGKQNTVYRIYAPAGYKFVINNPATKNEYNYRKVNKNAKWPFAVSTDGYSVDLSGSKDPEHIGEVHLGDFAYWGNFSNSQRNAKNLHLIRLWVTPDPKWEGHNPNVVGINGATTQPSEQPTSQPTAQPSKQPTAQPSKQPTAQPSKQPTSQPTAQPSKQPTSQPTAQPSKQPTAQPSKQPTAQPSKQPTSQPTAQPSKQPTSQPTAQPSKQPTSQPTAQPSEQPTSQPTAQPSKQPTSQPTAQPSKQPTSQPTAQPSKQPTSQPTAQPSKQPTSQPTSQPTAQPSKQPTSQPTAQPSEQPTSQPTAQPSEQPTSQPTTQPSEQPTSQPTTQPSEQPTSQPTAQPSEEESQFVNTQIGTKKIGTPIKKIDNASLIHQNTKQSNYRLPQTGNQKSLDLVGLGLVGFLSALGLIRVNKKQKN
ncbi:PT domain-containing protein [Limosilactobacillus reuteri]|nr:PT domain-containing protein [Limosilactobacillus reuteri]MDD1406687.1 PT domain-containing protein [Limosilactobacillus reuteri]